MPRLNWIAWRSRLLHDACATVSCRTVVVGEEGEIRYLRDDLAGRRTLVLLFTSAQAAMVCTSLEPVQPTRA